LARAADTRADALRAKVRARITRLLPGVKIREDGDALELSGRDLVRRWTQSDALRDWREVEP
jgi:hypothetical protein